MFKKIFIFCSIILSFFGVIALGITNVYADEVGGDPIEEVEEKPCKVTIITSKGGDAMVDIEEGEVGDVVTVYAKADFLFSVESIKINGVSVALNQDGKYQFNLVEGENIVSAEFKVNNEKLSEIANLISGVKEDGFQSLFTVGNLLNFVSWIISILLSSGFFITLIRTRKLKSKTIDEIVEIVTGTLESENAKILKEFLDKLIGPALDTITLKMDAMDDCMKVFCRCYVLAQDNTPENKLAIINELTKLENNDEALTTQIRAIVKQEQKAQEEQIIARDKAIEELKKNNENLVKKDNSGDGYGQL